MPRFETPNIYSPIDGAAFDIRAPRSATAVIIACVAIVVLAALGFYRGLTSARPPSAAHEAAITGSIVGATPAVPMAQNPNWSTLSGPQVLSAAAPKVQAQDDDADDSDTPDDQPAAADQPETQPAPVAATPAPAVVKPIANAPTTAPASEPPPY